MKNLKTSNSNKFNPDTNFNLKVDTAVLQGTIIGLVLEELDKRNTNPTQLAKYLNLSQSYISDVFNGIKPLNMNLIAKIQHALEINFEFSTITNEEYYNKYYALEDQIEISNEPTLLPNVLSVRDGKFYVRKCHSINHLRREAKRSTSHKIISPTAFLKNKGPGIYNPSNKTKHSKALAYSINAIALKSTTT